VIIAEPGEYQAKAPVDEIGQRAHPRTLLSAYDLTGRSVYEGVYD
jgi:hypothetical protein